MVVFVVWTTFRSWLSSGMTRTGLELIAGHSSLVSQVSWDVTVTGVNHLPSQGQFPVQAASLLFCTPL